MNERDREHAATHDTRILQGAIAADYMPQVMEPHCDGDIELAAVARTIATVRRKLTGHFEASLFANPGLEIMMFLFAEGLSGQTVTTHACCIAAGVPRTTALRWIKLLQEHGLVDGSDDINDRRVTMLALSALGRAKARAWLGEIAATAFHFPGRLDR